MAQDVSLVEVMARLVAAFALIIGLLGGTVYVFRRRGMLRVPGSAAPTKRLKLVERHNISRNASVALVRVGSSSYLVGATDASVSLLADVTETMTEADAAEAERVADDETTVHQRTGVRAEGNPLHSARIDIVGAILQRMGGRRA
jgi:flagellar biogenesis protein FliO